MRTCTLFFLLLLATSLVAKPVTANPSFQAADLNGVQINPPGAPREVLDLTGAKWLWRSCLDEKEKVTLHIPPEKVTFLKEIAIESPDRIRDAWFAGTADNESTLLINGQRIINSISWKDLAVVEFSALLKPGRNRLEVVVENQGHTPNPGGFVARVQISTTDGKQSVHLTDNTWRCRWEGQSALLPADELVAMGAMPWGLLGNSRRAMPNNFPAFVVPGLEAPMKTLQGLFFTHYKFFPFATLWDPWLPQSLIWPEADADRMGSAFRALLGSREMAQDGYVSTHQHRGMAHPLGWPFPIWTQVAGWGWHWSLKGNPFGGSTYGVIKQQHLDGFTPTGVSKIAYSDQRGMRATLAPNATLQTPPMQVRGISAPFFRIEWWGKNMEKAQPYLEWTTQAHSDFDLERRVSFDPPSDGEQQTITIVDLTRHTTEDEIITGFRIGFGNPEPAQVTLQAIMTAADSRHSINNSIWVTGCTNYVRLTGDIDFLREQIDRLRQSMEYAMREFQTREKKCVFVPWRAHDGRSGILLKDGAKTVRPGFGVGGNYWDLLPFGGYDYLSTIYFHTALLDLAELEEAILAHPEWNLPTGFSPADLRAHAEEIRIHCQQFFWNEKTGRYIASVDIDGNRHDYGFTFVNLEAIYYGMATDAQARTILDWIEGKRSVEGDTAQGDDIYHWRFGPRSTTVRNIDWYQSVWSAPESLKWGEQVQDGGAVLGFSYFDLMSRLKLRGADNAWKRLSEIIDWYDEVLAEGGVRAYYSKPGRGSLQGGGTAGGLGIDQEFFESAMVPQIMLYGFMGFDPGVDMLTIRPQLPKAFPSLTITDIRYQGCTYDLKADSETVTITMKQGEPTKLRVQTDVLHELDFEPGNSRNIRYIKQKE